MNSRAPSCGGCGSSSQAPPSGPRRLRQVYSHGGPIRCRNHGYIRTTDQSDDPRPAPRSVSPL
eukprot:6345413-Pyramimonas_sp.AAC.1